MMVVACDQRGGMRTLLAPTAEEQAKITNAMLGDTKADIAVHLARVLGRDGAFKVNLIPYNPTDTGFSGSTRTAIDAFRDAGVGARQEDVAETLGITQQAVSQRLRTALWAEEVAARPLLARLLVAAGGRTAESTRTGGGE